MTLSMETMLQVEKDIAQLHEQFAIKESRIEQSVEDAITQHQQDCMKQLSDYRQQKQKVSMEKIEMLRQEEWHNQEKAIAELTENISLQKEKLIDAITKEVLKRYGSI